LELIYSDRDNPLKPRAVYTLDRDQKRAVFQWLKDLKFPDGYVFQIGLDVSMLTIVKLLD
jgi:hypothetical protein